jgi:hypothetical protein
MDFVLFSSGRGILAGLDSIFAGCGGGGGIGRVVFSFGFCNSNIISESN